MKTAIYIEDGTVQLVITPETEFEKNALRSFEDKPMSAKVFAGSFYDCRGGWVRQHSYYRDVFPGSDSNDRSLILRMDTKSQEPSIRMTPDDDGAVLRQDEGPHCDTCGKEMCSALMAAFCPRHRECEFWPHDPDGDEFMQDMREGCEAAMERKG